MRRERVLSIIIAYKFAKAALWFLFAAGILISVPMGLSERLVGFAQHMRHHSGAWSLELAKLVVRAATRRGLWTITVALLADGAMSLLEGWALFHGRWWGPWLVVVATASFLPFEVVSMVRHPHAVRAAVLAVNTAIVVYLARKALREGRHPNADSPAAPSLEG